MRRIFPTSPEAIILAEASGLSGAYCIWKLQHCLGHLHFSIEQCGLQLEGEFNIPQLTIPPIAEEQAVQLCIQTISQEISQETMTGARGEQRH